MGSNVCRLTVVVVWLLVGCAPQTAMLRTKSCAQTLPSSTETKKTLDVIAGVLVNNGFEITMVNETVGIVTTGWRDVTTGGEQRTNTTMAVLSALGGGAYNTTNKQMQVNARVRLEGYQLTPRLREIRTANSGYLSGAQNARDIPFEESSAHGVLIERIVKEINDLLHVPSGFAWVVKEQPAD